MPTHAIKHLKNLEHLNLNENQISTLRDEAFLGLSKVRFFLKNECLQGVKKIMVTPIIQNMAYFLSFHAKVMQKNHLT